MRSALLLIASGYAFAQTPMACIGQLQPLKPASLYSCPTATPVCISDAFGNGTWVWGCPTSQPQPRRPVFQPLPAQKSMAEIQKEILEAEQLRLQNEQLRQQLQSPQRPPTVSVSAAPPSPADNREPSRKWAMRCLPIADPADIADCAVYVMRAVDDIETIVPASATCNIRSINRLQYSIAQWVVDRPSKWDQDPFKSFVQGVMEKSECAKAAITEYVLKANQTPQ